MIKKVSTELKVGDKAPAFALPDHEGVFISLRAYQGVQPVVLIFYPGDDTPDCTKQLCAIRDDWSAFKRLKAAVFGVNGGSAESHTNFWRAHGLKTPLLVDEERRVAKRYGAIRKFFKTEIIRRTVVVIDTNGIIRYLKRGLPPTSEILEALKAL